MKQLFTVFVISCSSLFAQTVPSYVPTSGLIGWWAFNGNANDASGNNLNGVVTGALLTSDRLGNLNSAYNFNYLNWSWGSGGDKIFIPYNQIMNTTNLSVSVWVNRSSNGYLNQQHTIINRFQFGYSNPNGQAWQIVAEAAPSSLIKTQVIQAAPNNNQVNIVNTGPVLTQNSWFHICMTFNGTSVKQFVNGVLVDSIPANGLALNSVGNSGISIGVSDQANGHWGPFDGKIDDIGIWNRALTQQEIANLYSTCQDSVQVQPQNFTAYAGTGWANFKCGSSDTAATYQWQQSNGAGWFNLSNLGNYNGSTSDSLVITGVTPSMNNFGYRCIIESCETDTTDIAILTVSNGIGLSESAIDLLTISPNPTSGLVSLNIEIDGIYELLTLDGRVLDSGPIKKEYELASLPIGVYNLRFITNEGFKVLKIVKNL